ncbi:MAG: hypothetical protein LWW95_08165 [Candidatus Desulfofervidus auxilii]|nr:hypothetical protein [Candidatus Desulfofervidus auxilii]
MKEILYLIEKVRKENPYPESVFPEISLEEYKKINELLIKHLGFPLDRLSGNIGRKIWNICLDQIKKYLKETWRN